MTRISEFQIKDIVNIADGKKLGNMSDLEINTATGKIEAIVVSNGTRLMGFFGREQDIVIPWRKIKKSVRMSYLLNIRRYFKEN